MAVSYTHLDVYKRQFETWCYRRIFKISWREKITNEDVFRRAQEEKSFLRNLKGRRAKFIGHILRHNGLVKKIIEGTNIM